eukprot:627670-Ditylum_brightwellii.AAC.1
MEEQYMITVTLLLAQAIERFESRCLMKFLFDLGRLRSIIHTCAGACINLNVKFGYVEWMEQCIAMRPIADGFNSITIKEYLLLLDNDMREHMLLMRPTYQK